MIKGLKYTVLDYAKNNHTINISISDINNGMDCIAKHGIVQEITNIEVY